MQKKISSKTKQKQLQTKNLQQQTKKMEDKLIELRKQIQQKKQFKSKNTLSTVEKWKSQTKSDAPLKNYAKRVLDEQKQAHLKLGIHEKDIIGTKTFNKVKQQIKQEKQQKNNKNLKIIPNIKNSTQQLLPIQSLQNNFFKAKIQTKIIIHQKSLEEFLCEHFLQIYLQTLIRNGIQTIDDLRNITRQQLQEFGVKGGHQIKIIRKVKEQLNLINQNKTKQKNKSIVQDIFEESKQKKGVQFAFGEGNVFIQDTNQQLKQNNSSMKQNNQQQQQQNKFDDNISESQYKDQVMQLQSQYYEIALQTNQQSQIIQVCYNCYKTTKIFTYEHNKRIFCSDICLKIYLTQIQKQCPKCGKQFLKMEGFYENNLWFCSISCCPNHEQIESMFFQWIKQQKFN